MVWNNDSIRELERASIRAFVKKHRSLLTGRVLDFGCGTPQTCRQPQPYRDLVSGEYVGYDVGDEMPSDFFDAILCTQVIQYVPNIADMMGAFRMWLNPGGHVVISGPTNWAEVEATDLVRYTRAGIRTIFEHAGFEVLECESRASINLGGFELSLGWGLVARYQG